MILFVTSVLVAILLIISVMSDIESSYGTADTLECLSEIWSLILRQPGGNIDMNVLYC